MLKGKWALVTGAGGGLGLAIAESLAAAGANIALHDLTEPEAACDSIRFAVRRRGCKHGR